MRHGLSLRQAGARLAQTSSIPHPKPPPSEVFEGSGRPTRDIPPHLTLDVLQSSQPATSSPRPGSVQNAPPPPSSNAFSSSARSPPRLEDPFRRLPQLLHPSKSKGVYPPLSRILYAIEPFAFSAEPPITWPKHAILAVLTGPTDQASVIRILPIILRHIDDAPVAWAGEIAQRTLGRLRVTRILPVVPTVMDHLLARLRRALEDGEADKEVIMETIHRILVAVEGFRTFSTITQWDRSARFDDQLPPMLDDEVYRLASFAIDVAESSPSSSYSPSLITQKLRSRLFSRTFLTPELMQLLLLHIPRSQMSASEWRSCTHGAIGAGGLGSREKATSWAGKARRAEQVFDGEGANSKADRERTRKAGKARREEEARSALEAVDQITLARCETSARAVIQDLEPFLDVDPAAGVLDEPDYRNFQPRSYAWSTLITRLSSSPHTTSDDLLDMARGLAEDLTIPHIMTPIIKGLMARGDLQQAWALFLDLSDKQKEPGAPSGRFVDRQLLAAVTPLCAQLYGKSNTIQLIDDWARRPSTKPNGGWQHTIIIDPYNLNVLLTQYLRSARPSVPLRLMAAALPRWGVWPDHISLNILLDCCRFSPTTQTDEPDTIRSRLRDLVSDIPLFKSPTKRPTAAVFDTAGLANKDYQVLLDPKGATWREMMGEMRPWQYARQIFRDVIFGNWPHLVNIHSPLEFGPFARLEDILLPYDPPQPGEIRHPLPEARYTQLIPVAATFQSYIALLGFYNLVEEIPTALSWARELGIQPTWRSMCSALAYTGEIEGPRRRVRGWYEDGGSAFVRDEEIMRRWLEEWVKGEVPTESDVARFVKGARDKGGRMSAGRWGDKQ